MKQKTLAEIIGISERHVSDLKRGNRNFTIEMTISFENATGIRRDKWAYPEIHGNPWEELKSIPPPKAPPKEPEKLTKSNASRGTNLTNKML